MAHGYAYMERWCFLATRRVLKVPAHPPAASLSDCQEWTSLHLRHIIRQLPGALFSGFYSAY